MRVLLHVFYLMLRMDTVICATEISSVQITSTNNTVRQISNLTVAFWYSIKTNSEVRIVFDFMFSELESSYSCRNVLRICDCRGDNRTMYVTNCFTTAVNLVRIIFYNITNARYAGTSNFKLYIYSSSTIEAEKTSSLSLDYLPSYLPASLSSGSPTSSEFSPWSLSLSPHYLLSQSDQIQVSLGSACSSSFTCTSNISLSCTCSSNQITIQLSSSSSSPIQVLLSSIQNPSSTAGNSNYIIKTTSNLGAIEQSSPIKITPIYGTPIKSHTSLNNPSIRQNSSLYIEFTCDNLIEQNSNLFLSLPDSITLYSDTDIVGIFGVSSFSKFEIEGKNASLVNSFDEDVGNNETVAVLLDYVKNPSSTQPGKGFLKVFSENGTFCEGEFEVVAEKGEIGLEIRVNDSRINSYSDYVIEVRTDFEWIEVCLAVLFPTGFSLAKASCENGEIISDLQLNVKNVSGLYYQVLVKDVKNFYLTSATGVFVVKTLTSCVSGYEIERNETVSLQMTPGSFIGSIELSSQVNGDYSSYQFFMNVSNTLPALSSIKVELPDSIKIMNLKQGLKNIKGLSLTCSLILGSSSIEILKAVSSEFVGVIEFGLDEIRNPPSFEPVEVKWMTSFDGYLVDYVVYKLQMNESHLFKSVSFVADSDVAGEVTSFDVTLIPYNEGADSFVIRFGFEIGDVVADIDIEVMDDSITIPLNSSVSSLSFKLENISNPSSLKPYTIQISSYINQFISDSDFFEYSAQTPGNLQVTLSKYLTQVSTDYSLTLDLTFSNSLNTNSSIVLSMPSESPSCEIKSPIKSCTTSPDSIKVLIDSFSDSVSITFHNLTSEQTSGTYYYFICSYFDEYLVDCGYVNLTFNCDDLCESCIYSPSNCTSCYESYFLYNNTCSSECLEYYYKKDSVCEPCQSPCSTCTDLSLCQSCSSLYPYFYSSYCYNVCPSGSYPTSSYNCTKCDSSCLVCSSSEICSKCNSGYFLYEFTCLKSCPAGYYQSTEMCLQCSENCAKCNSVSSCLQCSQSYFLYSNSCLDTCPEGITVATSSTCEPCESDCKTCSILPSSCTSCSSSLSLYNSTCISRCPDGFYSFENLCLACSSSCLTCKKSSFNCLSCVVPLALYENSCTETCPSGLIDIDQICSCPSGCETCNLDGCLSCSLGLSLMNYTCVENCPVGTFVTESRTCVQCGDKCLDCESLNECLQCDEDYFWYQSLCYASCPNSTYAENGTCFDCAERCIQCYNENDCGLCESSFLLLNKSCVSSCPDGYSEYMSTCVPDSFECSENCTFIMSKNSKCEWECYVKACNFDSDQCPPANYSDTLAISEVPVPISVTGGVGVTVAGVSAAFFGSSFTAVAGPVCALLETAAGVGLMATIAVSDGTRGRELIDTDNGNISSLFIILFVLNLIHIFTNLAFVFILFRWILPDDAEIRNWYSKFKGTSKCIIIICAVLSYKFFRITWSKLFGLKSCGLSLKNHKNLWTLMKNLHIFSIFFIELPIISVCIYIFFVFSKGSYAFIVAIDTTVIIGVVIILTIYEIFELRETKPADKNVKKITLPTETIDIDHQTYIEEVKSRNEVLTTDRKFNYFWKVEREGSTNIIEN